MTNIFRRPMSSLLLVVLTMVLGTLGCSVLRRDSTHDMVTEIPKQIVQPVGQRENAQKWSVITFPTEITADPDITDQNNPVGYFALGKFYYSKDQFKEAGDTFLEIVLSFTSSDGLMEKQACLAAATSYLMLGVEGKSDFLRAMDEFHLIHARVNNGLVFYKDVERKFLVLEEIFRGSIKSAQDSKHFGFLSSKEQYYLK